MGHATVTNISKAFNKKLHEGSCSVTDVVNYLEITKQKVHAAEGQLEDRCYLKQACQDVLEFLIENNVVEALEMTVRQSRIFKQWRTDAMMNWDCGDDGEGGEYGIFDSISWRPLKKRLPILNHVTH